MKKCYSSYKASHPQRFGQHTNNFAPSIPKLKAALFSQSSKGSTKYFLRQKNYCFQYLKYT